MGFEKKNKRTSVEDEDELFILPVNHVGHARSRTLYLSQNVESYAYVIESMEILWRLKKLSAQLVWNFIVIQTHLRGISIKSRKGVFFSSSSLKLFFYASVRVKRYEKVDWKKW